MVETFQDSGDFCDNIILTEGPVVNELRFLRSNRTRDLKRNLLFPFWSSQ